MYNSQSIDSPVLRGDEGPLKGVAEVHNSQQTIHSLWTSAYEMNRFSNISSFLYLLNMFIDYQL